MRAFIGVIPHKCGTETNTVTGDYKSVRNIVRFAARPFARKHGKPVLVEVYFDWKRRYGPPSLTLTVEP